MLKEIRENLYLIQIETNRGANRCISLYLIKDPDRSLLIDTGYAWESVREAIEETLRTLHIAHRFLDIYITHAHSDHIGQASYLKGRGAGVYLRSEEYAAVPDSILKRMAEEKTAHGVLRLVGVTPETTPEYFGEIMGIARDYTYLSAPVYPLTYQELLPTMTFRYGGYHLEQVPLRGHTRAQTGLADHEAKILFCADQVIDRVVSSITSVRFEEKLYEAYLQSLSLIEERYHSYLLLPGHNDPITDNVTGHVARIREAFESRYRQYLEVLTNHPERELTIAEIAELVYGKMMHPYSVASFSMTPLSWAKIGHFLEYAVDRKLCFKEERDGTIYYRSK